MLNRATPVALLVLLVATLTASAQITPESAARNSIGADSMTTSGRITGTVRTIDDHAIQNARVELHDASTGSIVATTYTSAQGSFELYNIPLGSFEVVATEGINEARERVSLNAVESSVSLRMAKSDGAVQGGSATVSVADYKVPDKARKEFERGEKAFSASKFDEARQHINKALEAYPHYAAALVLRGVLSVQENNLQGAEQDLQNAIQADPNYGMSYIAMGAMMNQAKRYDEAKRSLDRGIALSPASWQAYFEMSKALMGLQDFEGAIKNAARAQSLSEDKYAPVHLVKAHALAGLKRYDEAITEYESFLSRDPQNPNADNARRAMSQAKAFIAQNNTGSK